MCTEAVKFICSLLFGRATLSSLLKKHFGRLPEKYPIVSAEFPSFRHPCLALTLSRYMKLAVVEVRVVGTSTDTSNVILSYLVHQDIGDEQMEAPVGSKDIVLFNDKHVSFAAHGLYLIKRKKRSAD